MHPINHTVSESELDRRLALNSTEMLQNCVNVNDNLQSNPNFISIINSPSIITESGQKTSKITRFLKQKGFPFNWSTTQASELHNFTGFLEEQQINTKFEISNLILDVTSGSCPQQLLKKNQVIEAQTPEHFNQFYDILHEIFEYPLEITKNFQENATTNHQFFQQTDHYIGLLYNEPISIGLVYYSNGIAGIYWVGVKENHRKQGFGSCMIFQLLKQIRKRGYRYTGIQAPPDSRNVYKGLGFREISTFLR